MYQVSLSDDGTRLVTGSISANGRTGYALVLDYDGSDWRASGGEIFGKKTGEQFGASVSISADGGRILAGGIASVADPPRGVVRLYELRAA